MRSSNMLVSSDASGRTASGLRELNALPISLRRRRWSWPKVVDTLSIATQLIISQSAGTSLLMKAGQWFRALLVTFGSLSSFLLTS